ncbi:MAG: stage II sporulation protein P [Bacilli bacterium]|nr:stage II sporulation protein P [Bacilli bacterium]
MKKIRRKRKIIIKYKNIIFIFLTIMSFFFGIKLFLQIRLFKSNEEFILSMLETPDYHSKNVINYIFNVDIKKPVSLIENMLNYKNDENYDYEVLSTISKHIKNDINNEVEQPRVYIYNSHQLENYSNSNFEVYNITPNVMVASYLLKEKLEENNINALVEEADFNDYIKQNNWDYNYSYKASRYYLDNAIKKYSSLEYFIDVHRDAIKHEDSTVIIGDKSYAKVLFVVGLENPNYEKNLNLVNNINNSINSKYPGLSRGIVKKSGPNVNGVYNQDVSPNAILIEIGGYENKIDEVYNTVLILSQILGEIINEKL